MTMPAVSCIPQGFKALPLSITQLSLAAVLKCGQSFRWTSYPLRVDGLGLGGLVEESESAPTHEWRICLKDRVVCLRQSEEHLFYRSVFPSPSSISPDIAPRSSSLGDSAEEETLAFIQDYFQLDTDLKELYDSWSAADPVFRNFRGRFKGIRMLRQDPWECLISFICSSNNNISRISKMVQNLCAHFSPPLLHLSEPEPEPTSPIPVSDDISHTAFHPFPPPSVLSSPNVSSKLRAIGFGYRADFIQKTAAMLLEAHSSDEGVFAFLEGLRRMDTEKARVELMKLTGVGRKVADCILLMSLDKREVVPVDTHVYQIAVKHYGMRGLNGGKAPMTPRLYDEVNTRLAKIWGPYAGWAHSVLFTADLKSFSAYGLPTPSPTPTPSPSKAASRASSEAIAITALSTPPDTPSRSPQKKRKRSPDLMESKISNTVLKKQVVARRDSTVETEALLGSLAERVKQRRRITVKSEILKEW